MPKEVEDRIRRVMREEGVSYESAIRILKAAGAIRQQGKHLAVGSGKKKVKRRS